MMKDYGAKYIRFDEAVFERIQPSFLHYRKRFLVSAGLLLLAFFLAYPLFAWGRMGVLFFCILLAASVLNTLTTLLIRSMTVFLVTNRRIIDIDRTGLFEKHVAEIDLEHIQDIRYTTKGIVASLFSVGTITVQATPGRGRIQLVDVHQPARVQETLLKIQGQHTKTNTQSQVNESQKE